MTFYFKIYTLWLFLIMKRKRIKILYNTTLIFTWWKSFYCFRILYSVFATIFRSFQVILYLRVELVLFYRLVFSHLTNQHQCYYAKKNFYVFFNSKCISPLYMLLFFLSFIWIFQQHKNWQLTFILVHATLTFFILSPKHSLSIHVIHL